MPKRKAAKASPIANASAPHRAIAQKPSLSPKPSQQQADGGLLGKRKRGRGRPRIEERQDASMPTNRRREQVRQAQRAYRDRKEASMASLQDRVDELEKKHEDALKDFMKLVSVVQAEGSSTYPQASQLVNELSNKYGPELAGLSGDNDRTERTPETSTETDSNRASNSGDGSNETTITTATTATNTNNNVIAAAVAATATSNVGVGSNGSYSAGAVETRPNYQDSAIDCHDSLAMAVPAHQAQLPGEGMTIIAEPTPQNASYPVHGNNNGYGNMVAPMAPIPAYSFPYNPMPLPDSHSAMETTFGRRLQRRTVERGLKLITMRNPPPSRFNAVFGFCLQHETLTSITERLHRVLNKTCRESLNNWSYPFHTLGGAGTFTFDSNDNNSSNSMASHLPIGNHGLHEPMRPQELTGYAMGPFSASVEATRDDHIDRHMRMTNPDFCGDFYDPDEVEEYLRQRGIIIPGHLDYVEAYVDYSDFQDMDPAAPSTSAGQAPSFLPPVGSWAPLPGPGSSAPIPLAASAPTLPDSAIGESLISGPPPPPPNGGFMQAPGFVNTATDFGNPALDFGFEAAPPVASSTTKVTLDVNVLVEELGMLAACLGRTPGLRPKDVDKAVRIALGWA